MSRIKDWIKITALTLIVLPNQIGAAATIANIIDSSAHTEVRWNDGDPIIVLHDSIAAKGKGVHGRTFGHVIALSCDSKNPEVYLFKNTPAIPVSYECDWVEGHELAHVKQADVLGDLYIQTHVVFETFSYLATGDEDKWNPLEWGPYRNNPVPWATYEE